MFHASSKPNICCLARFDNISAKQLHSLFGAILNELNLSEDDVEPFKLQLRKIYTALNTEREEHLQQYKLKSKELEDKIERLEERFINEEIKADLYEKFSAKFRKETEELDGYMNMTTFSNSNLQNTSIVHLIILWNSRPSGLPAITRTNKSCNKSYFLKEFTILRKRARLEPQKLIPCLCYCPSEGRFRGKRNRKV